MIGHVKIPANAKEVHLSHQMLQEIPAEITQLKEMCVLELNHNCLSGQNWVLSLTGLPKLQKLSVRRQENKSSKYQTLQKIPDNIYHCKYLTELCFSHNRILECPIEVTCLPELRVLDLICNYIKSIPEEIENLEKLEYLGLSNNQLDSMPHSIGNLKNLMVLRLSHNNLMEIPDSVTMLQNLIVLSLSNNNLSHLPTQLHCLTGLTSSDTVYTCKLLEKTHFKAGN